MNEIIAIIACSFRAIIIIHNCATISLITPRESLARVQVRRGGIPKVAISTNETLFHYIFHYFPSYYISLAGSFLKFISTITISNSQPSSKIHNQNVTKILLLLCLWNIFATPFRRSNLQGGEPNLPRIGPRNNRCVYSILPEQSSQR